MTQRLIKTRLVADIEKKINEKNISKIYDVKGFDEKRNLSQNSDIYEIACVLATLIKDLKEANILKR